MIWKLTLSLLVRSVKSPESNRIVGIKLDKKDVGDRHDGGRYCITADPTQR